MNGIFISYRRDDSAGHSGRVHDRLAAHFGEGRVFRDVEDIGVGDDFVDVIHDAVGKCEVLLVVIGPSWVNIKDAAGRRRLDNSDDFVRLEVASALGRRDIRVIPVLVNGATMPKPSELPDDLRPLAKRNALEVRDTRFDDDVKHLIRAIGGWRALPFRTIAAAAGLTGVPLAAALAFYVFVLSSQPEVYADLALYEGGGELLGDEDSAIVLASLPDSVPGASRAEIENRALAPWELYAVSYDYERLDRERVRIESVLPYRELLASGGPVIGAGAAINWDWPRLAVKVINNSDRTLNIGDIMIEVRRSEIDSEPIIMIREMFDDTGFEVINYGWGAAVSPTLEVAVVEEQACDDAAWREVPMSSLDWPETELSSGSSALFDVAELVLPELVSPESFLSKACLLGTMTYANDQGEAKSFSFKTLITLMPLHIEEIRASVDISAEYFVYLEAGKSGYSETRGISHEVPPGRAEHFLLRIGTDRSAEFDLGVTLRLVGGELIPVDDVVLEILAPTYDSEFRRSPGNRR